MNLFYNANSRHCTGACHSSFKHSSLQTIRLHHAFGHLPLPRKGQPHTHNPPVRAASSAGGDSSPVGPSGISSRSSSGPLSILNKWQQDSKKMQEQLKSLGAAGVIAYGLFNTLYYTVAFACVWFSVADVPSGLGFSAAARRAAEVFALVWAGSQVTKLLRAGAALACAPLIDKGLDRLGLQDKRTGYLFIVLGCIILACVVMGVVIALHA